MNDHQLALAELSNQAELNHLMQTNKIMMYTLLLHIPFAIGVAMIFNTGVWFALLMSLAITSLPMGLTLLKKNPKLASISYGVALIFYSGLLIHLARGMIEAHFHIFVSLACLIIFANPWVVLAAAITAAVHHLSFYFLFPASVFNYQASFLIVLVHAFFVVLETVPCLYISYRFRDFILNQGVVLGNVEEMSSQMGQMINRLYTNSQNLKVNSDSQNSLMTNNAQTVSEMSSMSEQTSLNANQLKVISGNGIAGADKGLKAAKEMLVSIEHIKISNSDVLKQISTSNQELKAIVDIIKQIESKTQIINEIVFQTKLLSFNASVESARAGEAGRGFAVVAGEIGNLAKTSGEASKEISNLLLTSVQKVELIAKETEDKVKGLVSSSEKSISVGEEKALNCESEFTSLVDVIKTIDEKLLEISHASKEQSSGIVEINNITQNLEKMFGQNSLSITDIYEISNQLSDLSIKLRTLIEGVRKKDKIENELTA